MTKKKRLISMFAVMLIAIFSVGCVFAAACGKKDEEEPETEHVHEYTKISYDSENHWYECSAGDGAVDESTVAPHNWDEGTQTTDPTCGDEGVMTYKCECGATKTESINATGEHTFTEVVFTWTEDAENGGYTATASLTCEVCGTVDSDNADVAANVTSEVNADGDTVYTAKVTIGGNEYKDEKIVGAEKDTPGSGEDEEIETSVSAKTMAFTAANTTGMAEASYTVDGEADSVGKYKASVSSSDESVARAELANDGAITMTSVSDGSAYVTYSVSDVSGEVLASEEIYIVVDTTFVAYDEATGVYSMQYMAVKGELGGAFVAFGESDDGVTISDGCTTWANNAGNDGNGRSKSTTDGSFTWTDYAEVRNDDGKYITVDVPEGYTAGVTAYMSHTNSSSNRTAYISDEAENADSYIASVTVGNSTTDGKTRDNLHALTAESLVGGTYVICTESTYNEEKNQYDAVTMHCYAVFVTYEAETEETHQHAVDTGGIGWSWNDDYTSVTATLTCTAEGCDWENSTYTVSSEDGKITIAESVTTAATCGEAGSKTCTATVTGTTYSDTTNEIVIPATGNHTLVKTAATGATCDTAGNNEYWTCSVCNKVFSNEDGTQETTAEDQTISATGHTYVTQYLTVEEDSVDEDGWYLVCDVCQDVTNLVEGTAYDFAVTSAVELDAALGINNAVITLNSDMGGAFTVTGTGINLDLNGHSITYTYVAADDDGAEDALDTITVASDAGITIEDNGGNETNAVIKNTYTGGTGGDNAAAIYTKGTVVINGGTVESSSVGIRAQAGSVTMTDATVTSTYFTIWTDAGNVTVTINEGSVVKGTNKGIFLGGDNGNFGISPSEVAEDAKSTLIVSGGNITCENESAISTLGKSNKDSVVMVIYGGEISGTTAIPANTVTGAAPAIYMANGTLYVVGGTITGTTAIEVRGGSTTIYGGTIVSTADPLSNEQLAENTDHGATTYGYSLAVFPYGQGVTVTGKSGYADNAVTVTVSGGTFVGAVYAVDEETYSKNADSTSYTWVGYTFTISGGTFKYTKGLEDFLAEECGFNSWCNGYYEVTKNGTITRVYNFMDQDWTSTLVKDEEGNIDVDSVISMKGTGEAFTFGQYGLETGVQSTASDYYVAVDLSAYESATSVNVSIQFGNSGDTGDSNVIFVYSSQVAYGQWSAMGQTSLMGKVSKSVYSYGSIPAVLEYDVNFEHLTNGMLYLEWQAGTTYIYSITITVVE